MNFMRVGRVRFLALFLLLWASVVVARLGELQIVQGSRYRARAQRQQERRIEVSALRGSIFDRAGRPLAVSVEVSSVYAIPDDVRDAAETARVLARHLEVAPPAILARLTQKRGFVWIARKIDRTAAAAIRKAKMPGIHLVAETKRFYPKGSVAAGVLGYVGLDDKGLAGLEQSYDSTIRGKPGEVIALTDARRSTYGEVEVANARPPVEGASLVVSLDSGIQFAAEQAISEAVAEAQARSGVAILLDPSDGSVLAMAMAPAFDPNNYGRYSSEARRNHAIADAHEPGSTFKIVTGAVALENSVVTLDETIDTGDGTIRVGNTVISEHDRKHFGALTLAGVFEHSSNVGIIRVGLRLGPQRLWAGATALGVGRPTGIDLPGESSGIFRRPERWSMLSNATISMGQEVSLTPLQLARVAAAIANGGRLVRPRLVRRIAHPDGRVETFAPPPAERVLSEETARTLRSLLVGVVDHGTGKKAAIPGFVVAGKTGTAQKAGIGGYQPGRYVSSFVGFAPSENPRVVGLVLIEEPKGGKYYGGDIAAPVFARVVSQALGILRVAPEEQRLPETLLVASSSPKIQYPAGVVPASVRTAGDIAAPPPPPVPAEAAASDAGAPSALGLSARQALALFARQGLSARIVGSGFVVEQKPAPGAPVRAGSVSILRLAEPAAAPAQGTERRAEESAATLPAP
ncbi:MAG TPA: penicillin-binding protein [Thermoanaerobaculia bacterium]|jgi:cell division protein FtsI/penicillin-binding protein 2|nr:penicillin-binding protein [Thermoanaerobaculia bacterium]